MTIFSVYIYTNHVNNKWIQTIEISEGELDYEWQVNHEDENVVTSKIVGIIVHIIVHITNKL